MSQKVAISVPSDHTVNVVSNEPWGMNWRREALYLGLATMEACWFAPWLALILGSGYTAPHIPFAAILSTLLLGMYLTRFLLFTGIPLHWQRIITVSTAILNSLLLLRLFIYVNLMGSDFSWLGTFVWQVGNIFQAIPPAMVVFFANLYLWTRGVRLAQRDLSIESVGFSFRLGIVAFLWFFLVRIFGVPVNGTPYAFLYFFVGLLVVGLGRIESVSRSRVGIRSPFSASWVLILTTATMVVAGMSMWLTDLFSPQNVSTFLKQLGPVMTWLGKLAYPLLAVMAWLLNLLITSLIYLFSGILGVESQESSPLVRIAEGLRVFQQPEPAQGALLLLLQVLKWGVIGVLFFLALAILAASVDRVRQTLLAGRSAQYETVLDGSSIAKEAQDAIENRWRKLLEGLQAYLARLRGEEYILATIRQIYASLVKLAAAAGFPRREAETPYEYITSLLKAFPHSEREIRLITEAYVRAHYGQRAFHPQYVQRVRNAWLAIRARQEQEDKRTPMFES